MSTAPEAASSKAAFVPLLRTGQRVIVQGLAKAPELNGHRGVVVRWREDVGRYAVRVAGKEIGIRQENLQPEGGAAEAARLAKKLSSTVGAGTMYNPEVYARVPGAGPKMTQWIGQAKAGRRVVVRCSEAASSSGGEELRPVPLWFGDLGFVGSAPVDVALLIGDVGAEPGEWPKALSHVLDRFPVAAGRLRRVRKGGSYVWQIAVNNAGVPFTFASVPPCGLPNEDVLQLACNDEQCGFFDVGQASMEGDDTEEPLLRLKLTHEEGTGRGLLGVTFHHALCDISGLASLLRWLRCELDASEQRPSDSEPCHDREAAQGVFDEASAAEEEGFAKLWPLWPRSLERWCFFARRLRSGCRGRPDGVGTLSFSIPAATISELKSEAGSDGAASAFEALVCYVGLQLVHLGRRGRRVLVTKDFRAALESSSCGRGLERLFANAVTHGLSFELPDLDGAEDVPLGEACTAMHAAIDAVSLNYIKWQSKQDHFLGLPNMFAGLCCNTWGRALADLSFVEAYALGMRSVDERAAKMAFPLDTAYMQVLPQPSGSQRILLTMPVADISKLLKALPASKFDLPHISEMRTHAFRVPLPGAVIDRLSPAVETHHLFARIACIGDSITACGYPKFLQALFDRADIRVQVRNFGVAGATALKFSEKSYWDEDKLAAAREWRPHFVVANFGSNDSKTSNWDADSFEKDYLELCLEFLDRLPRPMVLLATPPPLYSGAELEDFSPEVVNSGLVSAAVERVAVAAERAINAPMEAKAKRARSVVPADLLARTAVVDVFSALGGAELKRSSYFAEEGVHPNERGTRLLALTVFADLRQLVARDLRQRADAASVVPEDPLGL